MSSIKLILFQYIKGKDNVKQNKTSTSSQVEVNTTEVGIDVKIASSRPPTSIGKQGDHVSAYALFKQCIIAAVATAAIEEAPKLILQIIDSYTETKESQEYFEAFKTELDNKIIFTSSELGTIKSTLESSGHIENTLVKKVEAGLVALNTFYLEEIVGRLIETHLTLRNKLDLTSFPTEGNLSPPIGEGNRVKQAIKYLKDIKAVENDNIDIVVRYINDLFWYPKIPKDILIDLNTDAGKKQWETIKPKYLKDAKPRDNSLSTLAKVLANHLQLIFLCFNKLHGKKQHDVINIFITNIQKDWSLSESELGTLKKDVYDNLPTYFKELDSASSHGTSESSTQTSQSISPHPASDPESDPDYKPGDEKKDQSAHREQQILDMSALEKRLDDLAISEAEKEEHESPEQEKHSPTLFGKK